MQIDENFRIDEIFIYCISFVFLRSKFFSFSYFLN